MRVGDGRHPPADEDVDLAVWCVAPQIGGDLLDEIRDVDPFPLHLGARHARQADQIVDEMAHALCRRANAIDVAPGIGRQERRGVLDERLAEPVDRA